MSLIYLTQQASLLAPPKEGKIKLNSDMLPDEKVEFVPNIVNSTVYIICLALQVSTFAVNHKVSNYICYNEKIIFKTFFNSLIVFY